MVTTVEERDQEAEEEHEVVRALKTVGIDPQAFANMVEDFQLEINEHANVFARLEEALTAIREVHSGPDGSFTVHDSSCSICKRFWNALEQPRGARQP
ncbi:MAG: hypothetical protein KGI98_03135 [Euryarchaeota archaeon]|nr:hypothetical protein [Euryarchaeota archaeon]